MKCQICKTREAISNSLVCSERCATIRLKIMELSNRYTPCNGCDNCWGDLHQGCTDKCREEFTKSSEFGRELFFLVQLALNAHNDT